MTDCRNVQAVIEAFVDGELPPERVLDVESHLERCRLCTETLRFDHAVRLSTQRVVGQARPSLAFRARVEAALEAEYQRVLAVDDEGRRSSFSSRWLPWRTIVPMAAAAAIVLFFASQRAPESSLSAAQASAHSMPATASPTASLEQMLEEFVDYHSRASDSESTEPSLIPQLEPQVGLPVRLPTLAQYGASWEGGGVVAPKLGPRTASLRYRLGQHRITVYFYDSSRFPLRATLEPRVVRNLPVYVGARRGYSIAAAERGGIGYALATDLGYDESAELAAALALNSEDGSSADGPHRLRRITERF